MLRWALRMGAFSGLKTSHSWPCEVLVPPGPNPAKIIGFRCRHLVSRLPEVAFWAGENPRFPVWRENKVGARRMSRDEHQGESGGEVREFDSWCRASGSGHRAEESPRPGRRAGGVASGIECSRKLKRLHGDLLLLGSARCLVLSRVPEMSRAQGLH